MAPGGRPVYRFPPIWESSADGFNGERAWGNRKTHIQVVWDSTSEMGGSLPSLFSSVSGARRAGRKMCPAGGNNQPPKKSNHVLVVTGSDVVSEVVEVEWVFG